MADLFQNKINQFIGDGARSAKFKVIFDLPKELNLKLNISMTNNLHSKAGLTGPQAQEALEFFCTNAAFPGFSGEAIEFKYLGRTIPIQSVISPNQTWTATFYNDEKHAIRQFFKEWAEKYQYWTLGSNTSSRQLGTGGYLAVYQYDFNLKNTPIAYVLYNPYPVTMSDVEVAYESLNQIQTFTVEFRYTHYNIVEITNGGLSEEDVASVIKSTAKDLLKSGVNFVKDTLKTAGGELNKSLGVQEWLEARKKNLTDFFGIG